MIVRTSPEHYSLTITVGEPLKRVVHNGRPEMTTDDFESSEFVSSIHQNKLLSGLNALRIGGHLLDITLWAEDLEFQAHRAVLSSCSDYFRAMFTDPMKEKFQTDVYLTGVPSSGLKYLLDFIYTSKLELNVANIQDVLLAATHLQVTQVVGACSNYLEAQLDVENSVDILTLSETYSLTALRKKVLRFMSENLSRFAESVEFERLTLRQLELLLDCDFPVDIPESRVLEIVLNWFEVVYKENYDENDLISSSILSKINFDEIPEKDLNAKKLLLKLPHLTRNAFSSSSSSHGEEGGRSSTTDLVNSRGMEHAVLKIGGFGTRGVTNNITYYVPSSGTWRHLTTIPHIECCNFGVATFYNELFVIGGCFNQSLQEHIHPFGFRYHPQYDRWSTIAPMLRERCRFSLTVVGKNLYAIGGSYEANEDRIEEAISCERYDPEDDSWSPIEPFPWHEDNPCYSQHAAVSRDGILYVSGGLDNDVVLNSFAAYDSISGTWERKNNMPTPRADHVMIVYKNKVLVVGGWFEDTAGNRILVPTVHSYDVNTESWSVETEVPTPRLHSGVVIIDKKIFVIGGFHSDVLFDRATGLVESYDLETRTWTQEKRYPQEIWEHSCAMLYIPRCRDDMEVLPL